MSNQAVKKYRSPLVSVIITSYNQLETIIQTLESILKQECNFPFEIIIGDDGSTDGTHEICVKYQKRYPGIIKVLFHQLNLGVSANFVLSIKKAKGKYIALCAADDFWHNPAKLQMQVDFIENHPDYGFLYTDYDKLYIQTGKLTKNYLKASRTKIYEGAGLIYDVFIGKVPALTLTVMFRKDLYDKYIPVDDYLKLHFPLEDWPTWLILSKYTKIGYLPISTGTYCYGHESISNPLQYEKVENRFIGEHVMYKYLCDMFPDDLSYSESGYLNYVNGVLLNLAYKKSDYFKAKKYAQKLKELGSENLKIEMTQNRISFHIFSLIKKLIQKLNN